MPEGVQAPEGAVVGGVEVSPVGENRE